MAEPRSLLEDLDPDPLRQLERWLLDAADSGLREPTAMALATVGPDGDPQVRMVLLRGLDERGLRFFTDYGSDKGIALAAHPRASVCLYWDPLGRQVRVTGGVARLDRDESEAYFATRTLGSRLAAWASDQSRPLADRADLEARFEDVRRRFEDGQVPLPPTWGGYRIVPESYEFWVGRPDRLHDRLRYTRLPGGGWQRQLLMP